MTQHSKPPFPKAAATHAGVDESDGIRRPTMREVVQAERSRVMAIGRAPSQAPTAGFAGHGRWSPPQASGRPS